MRPVRQLTILATALAFALALSACAGGQASGELVSDETPVPEGMPVMYEFFTLT